MKKYDVIVVGGGNAGLSAAATTAKEGLKTLLIERNPLPGGCATSFRRGRFEFEAALHEMSNVGTKEQNGSLRRLLESYGVDIDWLIEETAFHVRAEGENGYDIVMPSGKEAFCDAMEKAVPGSRESVEAALKIEDKITEAVAYLSKGKPDQNVLAKEYPDFLRATAYSLDECLDALGMPEKAQNIFKTYWPYLGGKTDEIDFAHYVMMLKRYISYYPAMPRMRSHELSLAVEKAIRDNGGEIRYNSEVTEVLFEGERACGVKIGDEAIYADSIVLNCFPEVAYKKLIPEEHVPSEGVKLINARSTGFLFFTVYLGLNRSAEELGIEDYSLFLYDTPDSIEQFESTERTKAEMLISNCINKVIDDASPEGTSILFLTCLLSEDAWGEVKPEDYKKTKNRIAKKMIETFEAKTGISVMPHIEEIAVSAPPTFARYLNTPNGTPYGYTLKPWDTMMSRIMNSKGENFTEGLYFVGAHSERACGYSPTYSNGNSVGMRIVREAKNGKS